METGFQQFGQGRTPLGNTTLIKTPKEPSCRFQGSRHTSEGCSGPVCDLPLKFPAARFRGVCAQAIFACVLESLSWGVSVMTKENRKFLALQRLQGVLPAIAVSLKTKTMPFRLPCTEGSARLSGVLEGTE